MRSLIILTVLAILAIPTSQAILGTEELPELTDAGGDVSYSQLHTGPRESDHLDVIAAWFSHDPVVDELHFTFKVADASNYHTTPPDDHYSCMFRAVTESPAGEAALFFALSAPRGEPVESIVAFDREGSDRLDATSPRWTHTSSIVQKEHGYVDFAVDRARVLQVADVLRDLTADCYEDHFVGPTTLYTNSDASESKGAYSVLDLRRERGPDGALDPIEEFERRNATARPQTSTSSTNDATPGFPLSVLVVAVAAGLVLARRK